MYAMSMPRIWFPNPLAPGTCQLGNPTSRCPLIAPLNVCCLCWCKDQDCSYCNLQAAGEEEGGKEEEKEGGKGEEKGEEGGKNAGERIKIVAIAVQAASSDFPKLAFACTCKAVEEYSFETYI